MAAGRPKSIDNAKVFDVAKPGKAKPLSTSRPVVGQAITVRDNSMITGNASEKPSKPLAAPSVSRKVIKPISMDDVSEEESVPLQPVANFTETAPELVTAQVATPLESKPKKEAVKLQIVDSTVNDAVKVSTPKDVPAKTESVAGSEKAPASADTEPTVVAETEDTPVEEEQVSEKTPAEPEAVAASDAVEPKQETDQVSTPEESPESSETASVDALAEASEKPKLDQKLQEEESKREAALQELIDSKKYFVPLAHDSSKPKKRSGFMVFLVLLLVLLVAGYVLVDAGIIDVGIKLPYDLIK